MNLSNFFKPYSESRMPYFIEIINSRAGTKYFIGSIFFLILMAIFLIVELRFVADKLALIIYYMLFVGVVLEINIFSKNEPKVNQKNNVDK